MKKLILLILLTTSILTTSTYGQDDYDYFVSGSFGSGLSFPADGVSDAGNIFQLEANIAKRIGYSTDLSLGLSYWFLLGEPGYAVLEDYSYESTSGFRIPLKFTKIFSKGISGGSRDKVPSGISLSLGGYFAFGTRESIWIDNDEPGIPDPVISPTNKSNFGGILGVGYSTGTWGLISLEFQFDITSFASESLASLPLSEFSENTVEDAFQNWIVLKFTFPISDL